MSLRLVLALCAGLLGAFVAPVFAAAPVDSPRKLLPAQGMAPAGPPLRSSSTVQPVEPSCTLHGTGTWTGDALWSLTPRHLDPPVAPSAKNLDIDRARAAEIATARAGWEWGPGAHVASIVPVVGATGDLQAWDVDLVLDGQPFGSYVDVARAWQQRCAERALEQERRLARGDRATSRAPESGRFASVTVSATFDAPPIRGSRRGVSCFYAGGWMALEVARRELGAPSPELIGMALTGSWERLFAFTDGRRTIHVQGHEPWGWYDADELAEVSRQATALRLEQAREAAAVRGETLESRRAAARRDHAAAAEAWLAGTQGERSPTYILGYDAEFIPYRWFGGCSPTSAGMLLNYYDELGWYGRITYDYTQKEDPVIGSDRCHVSDAIGYLRQTMGTNSNGTTMTDDIYPGMVEYTNALCGYGFSGGIDLVGDFLDWHFDEARAEIDSNHPFVWSLAFYPGAGGGGHSVAAVGYDAAPVPHEYLCYNTWASGGVVEAAPHSGAIGEHVYLATPHPDGADPHDVKIVWPDGGQTYDSCLPLGDLTGGSVVDITWINWDTPAHHVDLHYTTDAGDTWEWIAQGTADDGRHTWVVPCVASIEARVRIQQYNSANDLYSSDSSYGDVRIALPSAPTPVLLAPPDGTTCQQPIVGVLSWEDVDGAIGYEVQIGTSCGTGPTVQVTSSHYTYTGLQPGTTYHWRVRTEVGCGIWGSYGDCFTFNTGPAPLPPPALLDPPDAANCVPTEGDLDWADVAGAVAYRVQLGTTCGGGSPALEVTESALHFSGLEPGHTYYWRVRSRDSCGNEGIYSDCWRFTCLDETPPTPALLAPPDGASGQPISGTLDWQDVEGASAYRVRLGLACGQGSEWLIDPPVSSFDYSTLAAGQTYYWQVEVRDACDQWSPYSGCFSFSTRTAATWLVKADGTGDFPTIQAAIDAASGGDVIELADGTYTGNGNRDLDYLGKEVTVRSQSGDPAVCVISCGGSASELHRGVHFHSGETAGAVLEGVTIRYGYAFRGGGILVEASAPLIRWCHVESCSATESGGGIYLDTIYTAFLQDCDIYANVAAVDGGGIYVDTSPPSIQDCTIRLNHASFDGGGMMLWNASPTLLDCELLGNSAGDDGGGLCLRDGSEPTFDGCILAGNTASQNGGAVYSYGNVTSSFSECTMSDNSGAVGGGLSLRNTSTVSFRNVILSFSPTGASVFCDATSSATAQCTDVYGNAGGDWVGCLAGLLGTNGNIAEDPLYCLAANYEFTLHSDSPCATENNPGCQQIGARGIGCGPSQPLTVLIQPDGSGDYPTIQAAIDDLLNFSVIELADGTFTGPGNRDLDYLGKMLTIRSQSGDPASCVIDCQGSAADPHRVATFEIANDQAVLQDVTLRGGYAEEQGGAILCQNGAFPTITGCVFVENVSNGIGGAILCDYSSSPTINGCTFAGNFAADFGGAIDLWRSSSPDIVACRFDANVAGSGGAIDVYSNASPDIDDCTFYANEAGSGGALFCEESTVLLERCTFSGNAAPPVRFQADPGAGHDTGSGQRSVSGARRAPRSRDDGGGAICAYSGGSVAVDCSIIAWGEAGGAVLCDGGTVTLTCSDVFGNTGGDWNDCIASQAGSDGNLCEDPQFCDADGGNLTLLADSPCAAASQPVCGQLGAEPVGCGFSLEVKADGSGIYPTIQAAIDAAVDHDIVELWLGTYTGNGNRDLDYHGKAITVRSRSGDPTTCIIDAQGAAGDPHRGVDFHSGEQATSVLEGVTITGAYSGTGAAVRIQSCGPTLRDCVFASNHATDSGGAIHCYQGHPTISGCLFEINTADNAGGGMSGNGATGTVSGSVFRGNWALWGGGGMYLLNTSLTVEECTFDGNACDHWGGGFHATQPASVPQLVRCTFHGNDAPNGGAVYVRVDADVTIDNSILAFGTQGAAVYCTTGGTATLGCSDVFGNAGGDWVGCIAAQAGMNGNFSDDPLFCDAAAHDFGLEASSPCAAENSPVCGQIGALGIGCAPTAVGGPEAVPPALSLRAVAPNPFSHSTTVVLGIPAAPGATGVAVTIYDPSGRRVRNLLTGALPAGVHRLLWDGRTDRGEPARSGIYFIRMTTERGAFTSKVAIVR